MEIGTLLGLVGLALIDSTSLGTLLIPIWMMLTPGLRLPRFLTYLGTVAGFYFVVGVLLVAGAGALERAFFAAGDSPVLNWAQLVLGVGLFAVSFRYDTKRVAARQARRGGPSRVESWRARVTGDNATTTAMITLGLTAALLEVMTMLPYLAAVGLITAAQLELTLWVPVLLGYVLVMVLPALVLVAARTVFRQRVEPFLERLSGWMSRHATGAMSWVLGIAGFLLARDAAVRLGLLEALLNRSN